MEVKKSDKSSRKVISRLRKLLKDQSIRRGLVCHLHQPFNNDRPGPFMRIISNCSPYQSVLPFFSMTFFLDHFRILFKIHY